MKQVALEFGMDVISRSDARLSGMRHYFTGKPCRYGHLTHRFVGDARCAECSRGFTRRYKANNLEKRREKDRLAKREKHVQLSAYLRVYRQENRDLIRDGFRRWRLANKKRHNATNAKYRTAKMQRIPPWADMSAIRSFYVNCPEGHHVDHIHPLRGEFISGLHVIENLQYLPASENCRKRNKFDPNAAFDRLCQGD